MRHLFFICMLLAAEAGVASAEIYEPRFAVTYNPLETLAFVGINKIFLAKIEPNLVYLPFHFDGQLRISDSMGVAFGLIYRYENYHDNGPLLSDRGRVRGKKIWTNYHELFLLAGPRFSFRNTGLTGFYFSMKGGLGFAYSPEYFSTSLLAQPEIGYAFSFGSPGFRLELGFGVLAHLPFYETVDFAVPWKKGRQAYNAIDTLVHRATPIVNLGLGWHW